MPDARPVFMGRTRTLCIIHWNEFVGIQNYICGIRHIALDQMQDRRFINEGAIAEQFCAQQLLAGSEANAAPELNYWLREGRTNNAEVDFLLLAMVP